MTGPTLTACTCPQSSVGSRSEDQSFYPRAIVPAQRTAPSRTRHKHAVGVALAFVNRAANGAIDAMLRARRSSRPLVNAQKKRWLLMRSKGNHGMGPQAKLRLFSRVAGRLVTTHTTVKAVRQRQGGNEAALRQHTVSSLRPLACAFVEQQRKREHRSKVLFGSRPGSAGATRAQATCATGSEATIAPRSVVAETPPQSPTVRATTMRSPASAVRLTDGALSTDCETWKSRCSFGSGRYSKGTAAA